MSKVISIHSPQTPLMMGALSRIDFEDTFATTNYPDSIPVLTNKIFGQAPTWVRGLMSLRNILVKPFGIRTEVGEQKEVQFKVGEKIGFFEIIELEEQEVVLGADDKHLKFRVIILKEEGTGDYNVSVTTIVEYMNTFGKVYMTIVKPFHKFVAKRVIKQAFLPKV